MRKQYLNKKVLELSILTEEKLTELAKKAKKEIEKVEIKEDKMTKEKYWVT